MMTIQQIYDLAITRGMDADVRGAALLRRRLQKLRDQYETMPAEKKDIYDTEDLTNPYADMRMYVGDPKKKVTRVLAGIDLEVPEVLLADRLRERGEGVDLLLFHHPIGAALSDLSGVMDLQIELFAKYGIPINAAQSIVLPRVSEVARGVSPINHYREVDAARLLDLDLMCVHTPTDNMVYQYVQGMIDKNIKKLERLSDIIDLLLTIPEYRIAARQKAGPSIFVGNPNSYAGKIGVTEFTGGTSGSKDMYARLAAAGIGTIVGMHMREEHKKEAEAHHINVIIAGHMSSDSLGMNLFLDQLESRGVEVVPCSGLIRVSRNTPAKKSKSTKKV
jgi:putative NIF3 family GTP cyclohydrolase 1 type 2